MSDVLIKGMEMPEGCITGSIPNYEYCPFFTKCDKATGKELRPEDCPFVELPPHGRLIDIDRFIKEERDYYCSNCEKSICKTCWVFLMIDEIDEAPTILEANYRQVDSK